MVNQPGWSANAEHASSVCQDGLSRLDDTGSHLHEDVRSLPALHHRCADLFDLPTEYLLIFRNHVVEVEGVCLAEAGKFGFDDPFPHCSFLELRLGVVSAAFSWP